MSAELQIWRPRLGEAPVFWGALGQSQELAEFTLGEERGSDLRCCVHAEEVHDRSRDAPAGVVTSPRRPEQNNAPATLKAIFGVVYGNRPRFGPGGKDGR